MRIKRRTKRRLIRIVLSIPVILAGAFLYLYVRGPSSAEPANRRVEMSPQRIERGRYLFTAVAACDTCHSDRDFTHLDGPVVAASRGRGRIVAQAGLPGVIVAGNITPDQETGIGAWTDGEKIRAIREGIGKDGRALYPMMPYAYYRSMSDDDVQAVVAYLNSLASIRNPLPKTKVNFPDSMFMTGEPQPLTRAVPPADAYGGEIYGEYLATLAACEECHTPRSRMGKITKMRFAGGRLFDTPFGKVNSANITQDRDTGIGSWDFQRFRKRMQAHRGYGKDGPPKAGPENFTVMPWQAYSEIGDHDLESLFLYVKARVAIANRVDVHPGYPAPR